MARRHAPFRALFPALILAASLLWAAAPAQAQTANACPDILLGDSLAEGMGPYARELGFEVIAKNGAGISWLRTQAPRCARRLVLVFGTNDLRGMDADSYLAQIVQVLQGWDAQQIIWATPGCFSQDSQLDRSSQALERALTRIRRSPERTLDLPAINNGREARCSYPSRDGIHPATGMAYRAWWLGLAEVLQRNRLPGT
ncbi:hypothetical protein [Roseococcus sp. YIM B11640]|uniref:hypothetical protein n=1 Tax=Roseococcus sp. YIM B11640 TaxID=3133973 RepID=UPI003C7DB39A